MNIPNKLVSEKSPYLQQHAYNPVEWYPWSEEAFQKAKIEDKPIFLSIGYSTCYWCHVMEREVFEVEAIAKEMNRMYVNIKVDREERPDIDRVYMSALQAMTGSGGWPMSMFLTPDLKPFYGATYVPPTSKYGMPGFVELITQLNDAWKTQRDEVLDSGNKIIEHIRNASDSIEASEELNNELLLKGAEQFKNGFDEEYGGFGGAPKFPRPPGINFLLRIFYRFSDKESLQMVIRTLLQMEKGGMYDHLGGGFHRYSVDRYWRVPHFEKMLYDQAQLTVNYLEVYQITGDKYFAGVTEDILDYVTRIMTSPEGGFYSAEDAESAISKNNLNEKEEGAFYIWSKTEIDKLLGKNAELFNYYFYINEYGNAPKGSDPHGVFKDKNILFKAHSLSETSNKFKLSTDEINNIIEESCRILINERKKRPLPLKDDKILTSWNGLMISAFSKAYTVLNRTEYLEAAVKASEFIWINLYNPESKTLLHRWREGEAKIEAMLDDFAFYIQALIDLYEATFNELYLNRALELSEIMINDFYDNVEGGFFDTSGKDRSILLRTKEDYDSAEPTGNSIAIINLLRLAALCGKNEWYAHAEKSLKFFKGKLQKMPYAMPQMLTAIDWYLHKPKQIIIAGNINDEIANNMKQELFRRYIPDKVTVIISPQDSVNSVTFARQVVHNTNETKAYICENYSCKLPVDNTKDFVDIIEGTKNNSN